MAGKKGMNYPKVRKSKHGHTSRVDGASPEYSAWAHMIQRCINPACDEFKNYGARGIGVDAHWREFPQFLADMGRRPSPRHSIERIDNNQGYSKENCKWATMAEQARNTRRNRPITFQGRTQLMIDWVAELGKPKSTLTMRLRRGWSVERAFTT